MTKYSTEQLRAIFQRPFDQEAWKAIVRDIFKATALRSKPELFTMPEDPEQGYYFGAIDTPDNYRIGVFFYKISHGSVAHKKVGLRNLVKKFVNTKWGEFDAALVVFSDGNEWRLSFVCDIKEVATAPKRFTFVFGEHDNFYRTAIERFNILQEVDASFENIRKAFSVDALSDDFFDQYRELYADFCQYITGKRYVKEGGKWVERELCRPNPQYVTTFDKDDKLVRDYIKKMFGRIVFLYFLQRKGWLDGNRQYMHDLFAKSSQKDNFLDGVLEPLFFEVLNTDKPYRTEAARALPGSENIPYLNGGLFAQDEIDMLDCVFPQNYFKRLFDFLDSYNFTIDENDTDDAEVGIDPEMLGRIFENLLEDNKDKGAFYTPKEIVDYMCRESIIAYLQDDKFSAEGNASIRSFVENLSREGLSDTQREYLRDKLKAVKICDPAIGSGAFPMGLVNLLSKLYLALGVNASQMAQIKRHIIEQNIYGVDIEKGAVDIARLRFWLAMIVEEKEPMPLPNLHFKIMQGNSLLESYNGIDLSDLTKFIQKHQQGSFDFGDDFERKNLVEALQKYYNESDHKERDRLFNKIINNIRRQLYDKNITLPQGTDPSATADFFLWHTWFSDVFENGGFDIVIGNPPYIDSETMTKVMPEERKLYAKKYDCACGNWDMFIPFVELAAIISKANGIYSYIVPNKLIGAKYGNTVRELLLDNGISELRDYSRIKVFEEAAVYPCVFFANKQNGTNATQFVTMEDISTIKQQYRVETSALKQIGFWDVFYLPPADYGILMKYFDKKPLKENTNISIKGAATVSEAYLIKEVIMDDNDPKRECFKVVNTGLIDPYINLWGIDRMQYIKAKYQYPVVPKCDLERISHTRVEESASDKIIVAGMSSSIEAIYDKGSFLAGKSTTIILGDSDFLKKILGFLNSKFVAYCIQRQFNSLKMAGGYLNIGKRELESTYMPVLENINENFLSAINDILDIKAQSHNADITLLLNKVDHIVYHLYDLTYDEVLIVDPETPITREEYDNFKIND